MPFNSLNEAEEYLYSRSGGKLKFGLENIKDLTARMGNPEKNIPAIHVAGTNGKGSTSAMLESVFRAAGYKTGLYTSPHLIDLAERIQICGNNIGSKDFLDILNKIHSNAEAAGASFFEIMTAMAFSCFEKENTDIAVFEVGLGGRLDATNVINPLISVITSVSKDHIGVLGDRLKLIAAEKAGIMKAGKLCVSGVKNKNIRSFLVNIAKEKNTPLIFTDENIAVSSVRLTEAGTYFNAKTNETVYKDLKLGLIGKHQLDNAAVVLAVIEECRKKGWSISDAALRKGLADSAWPCRLQYIPGKPSLLLDSAHNAAGMKTLSHALKNIFNNRRIILVFGVLRDKDYNKMLSEIVPLIDEVILTLPENERAMDPGELAQLPVLKHTAYFVQPDINSAMQLALNRAGSDDLVLAAGSIYMVGDILKGVQKGGLKKI